MMNEQEDNREERPEYNKDKVNLMIWALQNAKEGKKIITGGSYQKDQAVKKVAVKKETKKKIKVKKRIYTETPTLDIIKKISPEANWSSRNLIYEACLIEQVSICAKKLQEQNAPKELIDHLITLRDAMNNGNTVDTKNAFISLAENWGGNTSANNNPNYHLLRSVIRLIFETYPLK